MLAQSPPAAVPPQTPGWVESLLGVAGGWGLFCVAYVDSSFGTLPVLNDLLVIAFSIQRPERMVFYALMASLGSILGCLTIFYLARKGGELALRKKARPEQVERIRRWFDRNEFLAVAVPAVLPPPFPFKLFVLAAGVFQVRVAYFLAALAVGRGARYFLLGFLAARYGERSMVYLRENKLEFSAVAAALMLLIYLITRLATRRAPDSTS